MIDNAVSRLTHLPWAAAVAGFLFASFIYLTLALWWLIAGKAPSGGWQQHAVAWAIQAIAWSYAAWVLALVFNWIRRAWHCRSRA